MFAVRFEDRKIIYNNSSKIWEYYNLQNDPKEISNIYDKNEEEVIKMEKKLKDYLFRLNINPGNIL